ncbi:hypothetical protein [Nocardioides sp.]|uniref:hypothetical protein n=1 Tax=Nocardioides sp. TaxID=35761 RepID=UPI002733B1B5|nr:hypothetical protein [Nocardioides sp.]MDP3891487.1 hypothetical protein [Nocardioides sp.]
MTDSPHDHPTDPVIVEAVQNISNRFGAPGLEQLIELAQVQLEETNAALRALRDLEG